MSAPVKLDADEITRMFMRRVAAKEFAKTAGEVRFIKDRGDDASQWAFAPPGASQREITEDFEFNPKHLKPLAKTLRSVNSALGFVASGQRTFLQMSSRHVSPDGLLGGKGYVQKISDIRRSFMNCAEALSAISDTLNDEVKAPHWAQLSRNLPKEDLKEVQEDIEEAQEIKDDPEGWAEDEMED